MLYQPESNVSEVYAECNGKYRKTIFFCSDLLKIHCSLSIAFIRIPGYEQWQN